MDFDDDSVKLRLGLGPELGVYYHGSCILEMCEEDTLRLYEWLGRHIQHEQD